MELIPDKRAIVRLVEQAYEGRLCLPNFQRDFVWPRDQVADLLRSILRRYYVGSLLLLRCDPTNPPFSPVAVKGAVPKVTTLVPELLVLDGQQRLTSLVYALTAPLLGLKDSSRPRLFFVDLEKLRESPDDDEIVFDRTASELDGLDRREVQYQRRVVPCTELLTWERFDKWLDGFEDWVRDNQKDHVETYRNMWRSAWKDSIHGFHAFEVPVVELPRVDGTDKAMLGQVCAIFEKLNSTGVDLSVYDLLTARLYRSGINLHALWNEACAKHERLRAWSGGKAEKDKFGVLVLRTIALLRDQEVRPRVLIELKPMGFEKDWHRAAAAIDRALRLMEFVGVDGFGVFDRKWTPGFGILPILAALRDEIELRKLGDDARADLRRWYWCNVFLERYSSAVESKSRKDYVEMLRRWAGDQIEPGVFVEARARIGSPGFSVRHAASHASTIYCGVFCLLAIRGARDWRRGEHIQLQQLQDHHIFPKAYLNRHKIETRVEVNSIVNRTLISNETNGKIKDKAPADYLADDGIFPKGTSEVLLDPHYIGRIALDQMAAAKEGDIENAAVRYSAFRAAREKSILSNIREVCGVPEPAESLPRQEEATCGTGDDDDGDIDAA